MQPILLDRYRTVLRDHGADAARRPDTVVDTGGRHQVFYVPFEHVNPRARLVLVGITPGPNQIALAYGTAQRLLSAGEPDDRVLAETKREGAFGGTTMRPNLVRMLDAFGFGGLLGIGGAGDLWGSAEHLLHATSVVPHAAFDEGKPFAGSFGQILGAPALRTGFERDFVPSLASLPPGALYVALGRTPLAALDWCAERGHLRSGQILGALAHPSTSGGSQVSVYLGEADPATLKEGDPVRGRVEWLIDTARRMRAATDALREGRVPDAPVQSRVAGPPSRPERAGRPAPGRKRGAPSAGDVSVPAERLQAFADAGYGHVAGTSKVTLFRGGSVGREVYLLNANRGIKVVVHPDLAAIARAAADQAGCQVDGLYHNDNMTRFPCRLNGGGEPVHHGIGVSCGTARGLTGFLRFFDAR